MIVMFYASSDELFAIFQLFSDFAYKKIDLVTGGVIVIGVVTGDQCFICCSLLYVVVCP